MRLRFRRADILLRTNSRAQAPVSDYEKGVCGNRFDIR
jgi:hypothetical protein